jgi:hypothetical protein
MARSRPLQLVAISILIWSANALIATPAPAQRFEGPAIVQATSTGFFEYQAVFTAGAGGDIVASYGVVETEGTDVGRWIADGFCQYFLEEGEQVTIRISGSLLNPVLAGHVTVEFSTGCTGGSLKNLKLETAIVPVSENLCTEDWECRLVGFCKQPTGNCGQLGFCDEQPFSCPLDYEPVCGCDGTTYQNDCFAARLAVSVDYVGSCNEAPDCAGAYADPSIIWPPNRKFHAVSVAGITDPDRDAINVQITSIFQSEPTEGPGDAATCPDALIDLESGLASVRAERSEQDDGRVYHIEFTADDGRGGECSGAVSMCAPHDEGQGDTCADSEPIFDSTLCQVTPAFAP